jgi:hypothetical protein
LLLLPLLLPLLLLLLLLLLLMTMVLLLPNWSWKREVCLWLFDPKCHFA